MLADNSSNNHRNSIGGMVDHIPQISLEDEPSLYSQHFDNNHHQTITSPSPPHSATPPIDIPYTLGDYQPSPSPSNFNFPGTPSYQGSYNGSFGSQHSPSHNWGGRADNSYDDNNIEDYNPSEYDVPDTGNTMYGADLSPFDLVEDDFGFSSGHTPSVSVVPADTLGGSQEPSFLLDGESPASSMEDPRSPSPMRSRASSIASSHGSPHIPPSASENNPQYESQWGVTAPSPPASAQSPSATGSRSPPALLIPDTPSNHLTPGGLFPPGVSHAMGPGLNPLTPDGPGINLIPATPVSGGGNGATTAPFSQAFDQINNSKTAQNPADGGQRPASAQSNSSPHNSNNTSHNAPVDVHMWVPQPSDMANVNAQSPAPMRSPHLQQNFLTNQVADNNTNYNNAVPSNPGSPYHRPSPSASPHPSPIAAPLDLSTAQHSETMAGGGGTGQSLNIPYQLKRERSKSETFSQRPAWALGVTTYQTGNNQPNNIGLQQPQPQQLPRSYNTNDIPGADNALGFMHPSSADAYQTTFPFDGHPQLQQANSFGPPISTQQPGLLGSNDGYLSVEHGGIRRARSDAGGHRRSAKSEDYSRSPMMDFSQGLLAPPSHPSLMVPGDQFGRGRPINGISHHRRASSGSRGHDRGGSISGGSSVRASPYPSPNASPMLGYSQLQPDVSTVDMHALNLRDATPTNPAGVAVARPHVTTSATQAASATRRTSEATFTCPVPGCGSTFTRHFNLKGHMRSHNDERPFKCKWPGCEKGFARQHDCKRHEQLHLNIRPYTCEGCSRTFARMDALNRHLRSEGGAECAKHQQPITEDTRIPKQEDTAWLPNRAGTVIT